MQIHLFDMEKPSREPLRILNGSQSECLEALGAFLTATDGSILAEIYRKAARAAAQEERKLMPKYVVKEGELFAIFSTVVMDNTTDLLTREQMIEHLGKDGVSRKKAEALIGDSELAPTVRPGEGTQIP